MCHLLLCAMAMPGALNSFSSLFEEHFFKLVTNLTIVRMLQLLINLLSLPSKYLIPRIPPLLIPDNFHNIYQIESLPLDSILPLDLQERQSCDIVLMMMMMLMMTMLMLMPLAWQD